MNARTGSPGAPAAAVFLLLLSAGGCGSAKPAAASRAMGEACQSCRMAVSNAHTAAQIAAPLEEPIFFDDIGCLRDYLANGGRVPPRAVAYVADHRTGDWVRAAAAVYTQAHAVDTPMGSHLIAHAGVSSREADPATSGGTPVTAEGLFGPDGPPDGADPGRPSK